MKLKTLYKCNKKLSYINQNLEQFSDKIYNIKTWLNFSYQLINSIHVWPKCATKKKMTKMKKMKLKVSYKQHKQIPMTYMSTDYFILGIFFIESFKRIIKTYNWNWNV
jgi:hypothetical protein